MFKEKFVQKKEEDIPEEMESLPEGGYVTKEAFEFYERWKKEAKEANKGRSVFKKIFFLDKTTPTDMAFESFETDEKETQFLIERMIGRIRGFFYNNQDMQELISKIDNHEIKHVLSEDSSGRLFAEIIQKSLNKIYRNKKEKEVDLISMPVYISNRTKCPANSDREEKERSKKKFNNYVREMIENKIDGGILYATEYMHRGISAEATIEAFSQIKSKNGKKFPESFVFVSMLESRAANHVTYNWRNAKYYPERERKNVGLVPDLFISNDNNNMSLTDEILKIWKKFSGFKKNINEETGEISIEEVELEPQIKIFRDKIVNEVSDEFVKLYNEAVEKK